MLVGEELRIFAQVKRFQECWVGDDRFRAEVRANPAAAATQKGLDLDPAALAFLWRSGVVPAGMTPETSANRRLLERSQDYLDFCDADDGAIEAYRSWRARQRARAAFAQGSLLAPLSLHLPFCVELTRGCSLGCWFCGLSASRLEATLQTDLDAWEEMLRALREVFGSSAVRGFMYWATDPLDHPEFEAHAEVFRHALGRFPATTTAAAMVNVGRTRRLIARARSGDCPGLRFSVVSRRLLDEVHSTFSADELVDVDLVLVNRESLLALADAGHARNRFERRPERADSERRKLGNRVEDPIRSHRTIACVSGLLIEPIVGRVRLITPEPSSDRWPDGYVVLDEARFGNAGEFPHALDRLVSRNMHAEPPAELALQRGVTVAATSPTWVSARGRGHQVMFHADRHELIHVPALAEAFRGGARLEEVVERTSRLFRIEPSAVRADVTNLWRQGVLVEPIFSNSGVENSPAERRSRSVEKRCASTRE